MEPPYRATRSRNGHLQVIGRASALQGRPDKSAPFRSGGGGEDGAQVMQQGDYPYVGSCGQPSGESSKSCRLPQTVMSSM